LQVSQILFHLGETFRARGEAAMKAGYPATTAMMMPLPTTAMMGMVSQFSPSAATIVTSLTLVNSAAAMLVDMLMAAAI